MPNRVGIGVGWSVLEANDGPKDSADLIALQEPFCLFSRPTSDDRHCVARGQSLKDIAAGDEALSITKARLAFVADVDPLKPLDDVFDRWLGSPC